MLATACPRTPRYGASFREISNAHREFARRRFTMRASRWTTANSSPSLAKNQSDRITGNPESVFAASRIGIRACAKNSWASDSVHGPVQRVGDGGSEFMVAILARGAGCVARQYSIGKGFDAQRRRPAQLPQRGEAIGRAGHPDLGDQGSPVFAAALRRRPSHRVVPALGRAVPRVGPKSAP